MPKPVSKLKTRLISHPDLPFLRGEAGAIPIARPGSANCNGFPTLRGLPIDVAFQPRLTAARGRLLSGASRGRPVLAGSFLRRREIVLDADLRRTPYKLERILVHELFHFVWAKLGNPNRRAWEALLRRELAAGARGELGWSAECIKAELTHSDEDGRSARWRSYVCESFCDTAGWLYSGAARYADLTLGRRHRERRRSWFAALLERSSGSLPI